MIVIETLGAAISSEKHRRGNPHRKGIENDEPLDALNE
jgi:hypothetical protein